MCCCVFVRFGLILLCVVGKDDHNLLSISKVNYIFLMKAIILIKSTSLFVGLCSWFVMSFYIYVYLGS